MEYELPYEIVNYNSYVLLAYAFALFILTIIISNSVSAKKRHKKKMEDGEKDRYR
ncbi:MAG: heme exporter protein CcmD [Rickettsiales bacterium]|nr:heme exporter protein CcmD [Rickettsiales bacterium]